MYEQKTWGTGDLITATLLNRMEDGIYDVDARLTSLEQMVLTNSYSVPIETGEDDLTLLTDDLGYAIMADWKYETA